MAQNSTTESVEVSDFIDKLSKHLLHDKHHHNIEKMFRKEYLARVDDLHELKSQMGKKDSTGYSFKQKLVGLGFFGQIFFSRLSDMTKVVSQDTTTRDWKEDTKE